MFCRLYRAVCAKYGPEGMTLSAYAFKHAQETGNVFWRVRIDAVFMLLTGSEQHCQQQHQRESRINHEQ